MDLIGCIPWIRFADDLRFENQRGPSKTYDCRLLYATGGMADLEMDGQHYSMQTGCLAIFQPGTCYCIRPVGGIDLTVIDFDYTQAYCSRLAFLSPCPADQFVEEQSHDRVSFADAPELDAPLYMEKAFFLEPVLRNIVSEFQNRQSLFRGKISTLFKDMLFELIRFHQAEGTPQDIMVRVRQYIDTHMDKRITNREVGEALNYNPNYLNRLTVASTGMSLHRYVLQRRLTVATGLLSSTEQPIEDIAVGLGFHSASHFSNFFKQATGLTPAQFRKDHIL